MFTKRMLCLIFLMFFYLPIALYADENINDRLLSELIYPVDTATANVRKLLKEGADPNAADSLGCSALMWAVNNDVVGSVRLLLEAGADVNGREKSGRTALMYAMQRVIFTGQDRGYRVVKMLLDKGADGRVRDKEGWDALMCLAFFGNGIAANNRGSAFDSNGRGTPKELNKDTVAALLNCKPYINAVNSDGETALILAAGRGEAYLVKELLARSANVNTADKAGYTALMAASMHGAADVAAMLADNGATINQLNNYGETALMFAAGQGHIQVVKELLARNADVNITSKYGHSATVLARLGEHKEIIRLLQAAQSNAGK